jgi:cation transport regulator ChaB
MPKLTKNQEERLPSTVARSEPKAQRTFIETLESAEQVKGHEGDEQYAHRAAYSSLKHTYEKVGDHYEPKATPGPSDERSEQRGTAARDSDKPTAGGVDAKASKKHLLELARRLDVPGRSRMTKDDLVSALQKANNRETAKKRS